LEKDGATDQTMQTLANVNAKIGTIYKQQMEEKKNFSNSVNTFLAEAKGYLKYQNKKKTSKHQK
jgi:hypothetical protein